MCIRYICIPCIDIKCGCINDLALADLCIKPHVPSENLGNIAFA